MRDAKNFTYSVVINTEEYNRLYTQIAEHELEIARLRGDLVCAAEERESRLNTLNAQQKKLEALEKAIDLARDYEATALGVANTLRIENKSLRIRLDAANALISEADPEELMKRHVKSCGDDWESDNSISRVHQAYAMIDALRVRLKAAEAIVSEVTKDPAPFNGKVASYWTRSVETALKKARKWRKRCYRARAIAAELSCAEDTRTIHWCVDCGRKVVAGMFCAKCAKGRE